MDRIDKLYYLISDLYSQGTTNTEEGVNKKCCDTEEGVNKKCCDTEECKCGTEISMEDKHCKDGKKDGVTNENDKIQEDIHTFKEDMHVLNKDNMQVVYKNEKLIVDKDNVQVAHEDTVDKNEKSIKNKDNVQVAHEDTVDKNEASNLNKQIREKPAYQEKYEKNLLKIEKNKKKHQTEKQLIEEEINNKINQITFNTSNQCWPSYCLPHSYYMSKINVNPRLYLYKIYKAESINIFKTEPKKLSTFLTNLDILFLQYIKPCDLLISNTIYLTNKNRGFTNFISDLLRDKKNHAFFIKVLKYLIKQRSYNTAECIENAFLRYKLEKNTIKKIKKITISKFNTTEYFEKDSIMPFDFFLKSIEDGKNNKNHEAASIKFCKIVEMLIITQNTKIKVDKKKEHFFLHKIFSFLETKEAAPKKPKDDFMFIYL